MLDERHRLNIGLRTRPGHLIAALGIRVTEMGSGCRRAGAHFSCARREVSTQRANLRSDFDVSSGWGTPGMVTRLARLVHNRQSAAAGEDKRHSERDHQ